jgi:hypothetical protein
MKERNKRFFYLIFIFQTERAVAMKLLIIIFVWVAAWTPFCMILIIQMAGYDHYINNVVSVIVTVLLLLLLLLLLLVLILLLLVVLLLLLLLVLLLLLLLLLILLMMFMWLNSLIIH